MRGLGSRAAAMIRVDPLWLAVEPLDLRAAARLHWRESSRCSVPPGRIMATLFANRRTNRMKVLVHDGIGVWLAARRLNKGKFVWPKDCGGTLTLTRDQFDWLVLGLPWQRIGEAGIITVL